MAMYRTRVLKKQLEEKMRIVELYDLATSILQDLQNNKLVVWKAWTREEAEKEANRHISDERLATLQKRLNNWWNIDFD